MRTWSPPALHAVFLCDQGALRIIFKRNILMTVVIFPSFFEILLNIFIFTYTHDEVGQNIDKVHTVEILKIINKSPIDGRI